MNINLYSIKDNKADTFGNVWTAHNNVIAIRTITQEVNRADPTNMLNTNAEDFVLWHVGTFDSEKGHITPQHNLIANLGTVRKGA